MSVTLRGHTFYTESEVSAMTPSGTVDSQWETYTLPINDATSNWDLNRFHVNKITGLVTGEVGVYQLNKISTSTWILGTNANLAIHSGMRIKYTGCYEYGRPITTAPTSYMMHYKELNGCWDTSGNFKIQGWPVSASYAPYLDYFLETHAYIGSKYGKITTTDVKDPIYLAEGAFYDANTVDLITGHAWLRIDVTLPAGYKSGSFVTCYKNLWSGEIILQYYLLPTTATNGLFPSITLPTRCRLVDGRFLYSDPRYQEGATKASQRQAMWLRIDNNVLTFYGGGNSGGAVSRVDGSFYYPGDPEVRPQNASYEIKALFVPESSNPISSAQNSSFPSATTGLYQTADGVNAWMDTTYFKGRSGIPNWVWMSKRTGMVFTFFDITLVDNALPTSYLFKSNQRWSSQWTPSYRYNKTSGTPQRLFYSGAGYLGIRAASTADAILDEYTCNICFLTGKSLGVQDTTDEHYGLLYWGTPGNAGATKDNLICLTGYYLGNWSGNIVK